MITTSDNGYQFKSESGKTYNLYEGVTFGGLETLTSDIIFVMDDEDYENEAKIVGWIYGASCIDDNEQCIKAMVDAYEKKA